MFFKRRKPLPAASRPPLEPGERITAWASTSDGRVLVATTRGLWLPPDGDTTEPQHLGWHQVHKATWNAPRFAVTPGATVSEEDGYLLVADQPTRAYALDEPGELPKEVHTRVTRSVTHTSHHELSDGRGLRVVGRRVSGVDGLTWHVRYDPGTLAGDPEAAEAATTLVAEARAAQPRLL